MPRGKREAAAQVWGDRVRRWKESGLSSREFAHREGIARPQSLSWWAWRLSKSPEAVPARPKGKRPELRVVRLDASALAPKADDPLEIVTPLGLRLLVTARTDEEAIRRTLRALGVRP